VIAVFGQGYCESSGDMTIGRLEIWKDRLGWDYGTKHWLPANYSAPACWQIRWLWFGFVYTKKKYTGYDGKRHTSERIG